MLAVDRVFSESKITKEKLELDNLSKIKLEKIGIWEEM